MAVWRRRVLDLFPTLRVEAQRPEFSIYSAFFHLLPMVREAHATNDEDMLRNIYGFAEWCFEQKAEHLWRTARVTFYWHLFENPQHWEQVVPWLSPYVISGCSDLWQALLSPDEWAEVQRLIQDRREYRYREARLIR